MATYTIKIVNDTGDEINPRQYFAFSEIPKVAGFGGVYANAWITFAPIFPKTQHVLQYTNDLYAYWGQPPKTVAPGTIVSANQPEKVTLGPNGTCSTFQATPIMRFLDPPTNDSPAGAFTIKANSDFTSQDNIAFGLAKVANDGLPSPVASFNAEPETTYNIYPVTKFYVAAGEFDQGQVIDVQAIGDSAEIDFTGKNAREVIVTQTPNGKYTIQYVESSIAAEAIVKENAHGHHKHHKHHA